MVQINPKQVEWLVLNQPETEHYIECLKAFSRQLFNTFKQSDIFYSKGTDYEYYLTPETYNSLPQTFKDLTNG